MCERLASCKTLVEGMDAVKFGDVTASRKKELEEMIKVLQMHLGFVFSLYQLRQVFPSLTKAKRARIEAMRRQMSNTPDLTAPPPAIPGYNLSNVASWWYM